MFYYRDERAEISKGFTLYFTEKIVNDQGKDRPVESKYSGNKWRWWVIMQKIRKRNHRPNQNNFDRV